MPTEPVTKTLPELSTATNEPELSGVTPPIRIAALLLPLPVMLVSPGIICVSDVESEKGVLVVFLFSHKYVRIRK